jgi:hypothetical protein
MATKVYSIPKASEKSELELKREAQIEADRELEKRRQAIDKDEAERTLADKYDLVEMYRRDPALFPIEVSLWHILIEMVSPSRKYGGILEKTPQQQMADEYLTKIGRVIACGPSALEGKTESGIELKNLTASVRRPEDLIGKYIVQMPHTGVELPFAPLPAKKLKIISVTEIAAVTTNPTMFMKP